ncbi:MAG: septal ring lytic transglycosylase RlpA family protein [Sphingomonadaceae bacterium]|nr:septal ring lytic transglycosylase RlpA family protein [Sphingomonadaceae bacterium]
MRYVTKLLGLSASLAVLASCGTVDRTNNVSSAAATSAVKVELPNVSDDPVKLGAPYTVGSTTYTPQDTPLYDEVGYAGYYGAELVGRPTANGEIFNPGGATAAHKTLPMPSYIEVTSLDTGRTILVRVNDRGPFANDRLIDLSEGAAKQLGLGTQAIGGVRVRRVNPPEQEKSVLRQGLTAAERIETPESLLKVLREKLAKLPRPSAFVSKVTPVVGKQPPEKPAISDNGRFIRESGKAASSNAAPPLDRNAQGEYVAQIGAFSSRARADALARKAGATVVASSDGRLFRVRFGPFVTQSEASAAARKKGYPQARIYRD